MMSQNDCWKRSDLSIASCRMTVALQSRCCQADCFRYM